MTIFRGSFAVLCAVTIPPADLRSLSLSGGNSGGTPEVGLEKIPKHVGDLYLQTLF
jgi:hypothetical protein